MIKKLVKVGDSKETMKKPALVFRVKLFVRIFREAEYWPGCVTDGTASCVALLYFQ